MFTTISNYGVYLTTVSNRLEQMGKDVLNDWKGSYKTIFIQNECSSATASVDKLTNDFIFNFEKHIRVAKIGKPICFFKQYQKPVVVRLLKLFIRKMFPKSCLSSLSRLPEIFLAGKAFQFEIQKVSV